MIRIYRHDIEVPPSAIDENGHVNNVQYVQWMQDAAVQHSNASGCTQATLALGATWVIRSHQVEYLRPAFLKDHIVVLTWVSNFRKVRSLRKYRFFRASDKAILANGETDWVLVNSLNGRPLAIPNDLAALFELIPEQAEPSDFENLTE
jgi:acyl-CoA thioester hydrolase